ncbi:tRNA-methyltransferase-domain-containing protein [Hypoxylon argillaceum]|nr:tRNA-methyltransferase-domain-containing protein [Hypoxylon argillaceum]
MAASEAILPEYVASEKSAVNEEVELVCHADTSNLSNGKRGVKRPAEDEIFGNDVPLDDGQSNGDTDTPLPVDASGEAIPMSKSQLKKLKRRQKWEENKADRRLKRRDKRQEKQARKRVKREEEVAAAAAEGREFIPSDDRREKKSHPRIRVPVSIVIDCQFEKYMLEGELISLSSQVTRCYSDNKGARHPVHLYVSSYGGVMKERNETVLENQHLKWKGIKLCAGDFVEVANEAKEAMAGPSGGEMIDLLNHSSSGDPASSASPTPSNTMNSKPTPIPEPEAEDVDKSIVYLTADSPHTLDRLEPNTTYVVGGIIDKNREKGLCYRIAREKNVRTAKLPIGEYMVLQHRHILATNHVVEIMLKWLETGDWAAAFMQIIPTRKGGKLKTDEDTTIENTEGEAARGPKDTTVDSDIQEVDATQLEAQEPRITQNADNLVEVEGDNAEEGLTKNSLDESRWSAPPPELGAAGEEKQKPDDSIAS